MGKKRGDKSIFLWYNPIIRKRENKDLFKGGHAWDRSFFICKGGSVLQSEITAGQVMEELSGIAFARATDYLQVKEGVLTVADSSHLTQKQASAIASIEKTSAGVKVKFYDKLKALELLGKALGLFEGAAAQQENNNLLEAIVLATGKEVEVDDIPEIQQAAASCHQLVESAEMEGL